MNREARDKINDASIDDLADGSVPNEISYPSVAAHPEYWFGPRVSGRRFLYRPSCAAHYVTPMDAAPTVTQLYRLLDQTNYEKSIDQLVSLLQILDCDVDPVVRAKSA